jgi:hypothetical protein
MVANSPSVDGFDRYVAQPQCINSDPYDFVISANIHRRHLTAEDKRDLIAKLLKAQPKKSNRQIGKMANASHVTVGAVRAEMESTGQIDQLKETTGEDGKARKRKRSLIKPEILAKIPETAKRLAEGNGGNPDPEQSADERNHDYASEPLGISASEGDGDRNGITKVEPKPDPRLRRQSGLLAAVRKPGPA